MAFIKKPNEDLSNGAATGGRSVVSPLPPNPLQVQKPHNAQNRSVIDACLLITGILEGDGELQVDGQVQGDIRCTHLIVGKEATVNGNIAADEVVVRGKVQGVIGANRVILAEGAHVQSSVFHKKLAIEEGARFDGEARCRENPIDEMEAMAAQMKGAQAQRPPTASDVALTGTEIPPAAHR